MHDESGVTLVELLVVILIVTILAVGLLPTFKKFVVQAQYASEPLALIGHLRTQIGLYQYENNLLPATGTTTEEVSGGEIKLKKGTGDFYLTYIYDATDKENPKYVLKKKSLENGEDIELEKGKPEDKGKPGKDDDFLKNMDLQLSEMQGNRVMPNHVQFAVVLNGAQYCYALGVFGDGNGLPANTGYAVMEMEAQNVQTSSNASDSSYKLVAQWKNYTGSGTDETSGNQIRFGNVPGPGVCLLLESKSKAFKREASTSGGGVTKISLKALDGAVGNLKTACTCGTWSYPDIVRK